jgi:RloB-like protein
MSKRKDLAPVRPKKRPYNPKERRKRFLLYCEGEGTEPDYFIGFARFLRTSLIEVEIAEDRTTDPKRLVELAKAKRFDSDREAERARDDSLRYDEVWCVFDRDDHAHFNDAINQAMANNLNVAVSNPCFELWILVHFQDQYAFIAGHKALSAVKKHLPAYNKRINFLEFQGKVHLAIERAEKMQSIAEKNGKWTDNPTSSVWKLTKQLCHESNVSVAMI